MTTVKKRFSVLLLALLLALGLFSIVFINPPEIVKADSFDGRYVGWGDSIMSPNFLDDKNFVYWMEARFGDGSTNASIHGDVLHSKTSVWGLSNFNSFCEDMGNYYVEMFGINDCKTEEWVSAVDIAQNKMAMYNRSVANNSEDHYLPCVHTLADPATSGRPWSNQCDSINATENHFVKYSVRFIPMYDCLDTVPYNGQRDSFDSQYYGDVVHPNTAAHKSTMSHFLWFFIDGQDYTETYHSNNDTTTIQANYNQTIYIYPEDDWDLDNVIFTCQTNDTVMTFDQGVDVNGLTTIQFDALNGSYYTISGQTTGFRYINNGVNNSNTTLKTRSFDFRKVENALYYNIEISNASSFPAGAYYINISDINNSNYGVNYYEYVSNGVTYVHFNYTSNVEWGYKYYRVRAYRYVD